MFPLYTVASVSLIISYILLYHSFLNLSIKLLHACDVFTHFCQSTLATYVNREFQNSLKLRQKVEIPIFFSNLQEGPHL